MIDIDTTTNRVAARVLFSPLLLVLLIMFLMIQSCGFHLRGELNLPQNLSPMFIEKNTAFELSREIKSLLANNSIGSTDDEEASNAQLELVTETKKRGVLSVDSNGRAREYRLNYTVVFSFKAQDINIEMDKIVLSRSLLFDTGTVLAVENESEVLYREMQRDASRLILLKLQAYSLNN